jgi:hypothetical protein
VANPAQPVPPPFRNTDVAPFIYFDAAASYGILAGAVEVELTARALIPNFSGGPTTAEIVPVARLRCSPFAATALMESLRLALEMAKTLQEQADSANQTAAATKLN